MPERMLTQDEVARYFGVCTTTVRSWHRKGWLGVVRIGRLVRYTQSDVDDFAEWLRNKTKKTSVVDELLKGVE